ncbi:MAG TPA: cyclic nucleotide-binding domain-containing protein [Thermoanaerobaculia bacterium]|nr:cyclic nucleotide-binding domain-containing protein [Thermoanaerobaculia bacterium]
MRLPPDVRPSRDSHASQRFARQPPGLGGSGEGPSRPTRLWLESETYPPNQVIYRTGDPCDGLYVVTAGGVLLRNETPGRPIDRVLDVGTGELFGETEIVEGTPRRFTARR